MKEKRFNFQFQVPAPPEGKLVALSNEEAEKWLLNSLAEAKDNPVPALWQLAQFYKLSKQHEKALQRLRELMNLLPDVEEKANCVLTMGQAMEQAGDYPAAIRYYREALGLEPSHTFTWYFINNNLGFCLNTLGKFTEGETYCRRAIAVDASRPNAYKNTGIALAGQGNYREAAACFVTATQVNAADDRSLRLLEDLVEEHPELEFEFGETVEMCRKAVDVAAEKVAERRPTVERGWRKHWILLGMRFGAVYRRVKKLFQ